MSEQKARDIVRKALCDVAPDLEGLEIEDEADLRRSYDIDSADYLAFLIKLHEQTGIDIPEADYPKLATLGKAVAYIAAQSSQ